MGSFSTAALNAALDAVEALIGLAPVIEIRSGPPPATADAADSGLLLAAIPLPADWLANAIGGSKAQTGVWPTVAAVGSGTAGHFRVKSQPGGACHMQGIVTAEGLGGDMELETIFIGAGQPVSIGGFQINTSAPLLTAPAITYLASRRWPDAAQPGDVIDTFAGAPTGAVIEVHGLEPGAVVVDGQTLRAGPNYAEAMDARIYFIRIVTRDPVTGEFSTTETYPEVYSAKTAAHLPATHFYQAADADALKAALADIKARTLAQGDQYPGCVVELTPGVEYDLSDYWVDVASTGRRIVIRSGGPGRFTGPRARIDGLGIFRTQNLHVEYVELVRRCLPNNGIVTNNRRAIVAIRGQNRWFGFARCRMVGGYRGADGRVDPAIPIDPYRLDYPEYANLYLRTSAGVATAFTLQPCGLVFESATHGTAPIELTGRYGIDPGGQQVFIGDNTPTGGDTDNTGWPATGGFQVVNQGTATTPFSARLKVEGGWVTAIKVDSWGVGIVTTTQAYTQTAVWTAAGFAAGRRRDMAGLLPSVFADTGATVDGVTLTSNTGRTIGMLCYDCDISSVNLVWQSEPFQNEPNFVVGNRLYATYGDISSWVMSTGFNNLLNPSHFCYNIAVATFSDQDDFSQPHGDYKQRRTKVVPSVWAEKIIGNLYHAASARGSGSQGNIIEADGTSWHELEDVGNMHLGGQKNVYGADVVRNYLTAYNAGLMDQNRPGPTGDFRKANAMAPGGGTVTYWNNIPNVPLTGTPAGGAGGLRQIFNSAALSASEPYTPHFVAPLTTPIDSFAKLHEAWRPTSPEMADRGPAASKTMVMDHENRAWRVESVPMILPFGTLVDVAPGSHIESPLRHLWRGRLWQHFEPLDGLEWRRAKTEAEIAAAVWKTTAETCDFRDVLQLAMTAPSGPAEKLVKRYRIDGHEQTWTIFTSDLTPATRVKLPPTVTDANGAIVSRGSFSQSTNAASVTVPSTNGGGVKKLVFHVRFRTPSVVSGALPVMTGATTGGLRWSLSGTGWFIRFGSNSNTPIVQGTYPDTLQPGRIYSLLIQIDNTPVSPVLDDATGDMLEPVNPLCVRAAINGTECALGACHTGSPSDRWDTLNGTRNMTIPLGSTPVVLTDGARTGRAAGWEIFDIYLDWGNASYVMGDPHDYEGWGRRFSRLLIGSDGSGPTGAPPKVFMVFDTAQANSPGGIANLGSWAMQPFVRSTASPLDQPYI